MKFAKMSPSSDAVRHMTAESPVRSNRKRQRLSCVPRQPERGIKTKRLQYNCNQPSSSGQIDLRISSSCTFM
ncbi:unnamed protein product [Protopolystoma xenopodis]|uniref:Uncharacterized protein n=1 Tax=Protopolystoma xenopodis TaxID=117903 RepID=A0A3S5A6L2_9PLAT|nr:unnamed protein product [Protopolystoma xenopodis]